MTPANIERVIKQLRSAFKQAVRWEVIARNPFDFVTLPKVEKKSREIWTAETIRKALDSCKDAKLFVAMNLAFACSLRVGEILGLTWNNVSISDEDIAKDDASVYVDKELFRASKDVMDTLGNRDIRFVFPPVMSNPKTRLILKTPKTATSVRRVWLPKTLAYILREWRDTQQKQKEFLTAQATQLDKLDFLMQAMIKTSRLETGVISLEKKSQPLYDTLAAALGGILLNAEKKQINVQVDCPENLVVSHDRKWTSEALFNILDNAVKYTPEGGQIRVSVESWEMYVKIDIADTGIGISEQHQGAIFKRFYREDIVHDVDGIGIGLYLAREIVTLQGGYIRVTSEVGKGSTFSVFLPRQ